MGPYRLGMLDHPELEPVLYVCRILMGLHKQ